MEGCHRFPVSIAIKVTSDNPQKAEIIEISIVPLAFNFLPCVDIVPLTVYTKPTKPDLKAVELEAARGRLITRSYPAYMMASRQDVTMAQTFGSTYEIGMSIIDKWMLSISGHKEFKLLPVSYGYGYMLPFMTSWFGQINYDSMFDWHYRDIFSVGLYLNDRARSLQLAKPIQGTALASIAKSLGIPDDTEKDTMAVAVKQARIYKRMLELFH